MTAATTIRPIEARDRDAWRALFTAYGAFYETAFDDAVLDGVWAWLTDDAHEVSALVAELAAPEGPRIVGFAHLRRQSDTFTAGPGWFLDDLYVDPEHRGAGVAGALIAACEAAAHAGGGGTLRWITAADNSTAQRLYDRVATRTTWVTYEKET
jgi:ribosomal protein S18 acetylase RimI-like enzyme